MNTRTFIAALLTCGIVSGAIFAWSTWYGHRSKRSAGDLERTTTDLGRRLRDAEARLDAVASKAASATTVIQLRGAPGHSLPDSTETDIAGNSPPELPIEPPSNEDQRAFVQASFGSEEVDPSWSREAGAQVQGMFTPLTGRDTAIRSVECRSSLCRVELSQSSEEESKRIANEILLGGNLGWQGAISASVDAKNPDGSVSYVLYLARGDMPTL